MFSREKVAIILAEFLGTGVLASVVLAMMARTSFPFFAAIGAGLTAGVLVLSVGRVSGAHANPAITIGLWTQKKIDTMHALVYLAAQVLGGVAAWKLGEYLLANTIPKVAQSGFDWRVFIAEGVGAAVFGYGVASAVFQNIEGAQKAAIVGISLTLGILVASLGSSALINPAVAITMRSWNWSYATGPIAGVVVGMNIYGLGLVPTSNGTGKKKR